MKTVYSFKRQFQSNHLSLKCTTTDKAVFRATKLRVFCHAWLLLSLGRVQVLPGPISCPCFQINMVQSTVVTRTAGMNRTTNTDFWKACLVQTLYFLKNLFVIRLARFVEGTEKRRMIRDWEWVVKKGKRSGVISWLTIVVRSEKVIVLTMVFTSRLVILLWDALRSKSKPFKVPINLLQHLQGQ